MLKQVIGEKCLDSVKFDQEMKRRKQSKLDASRVTSVARLTRISIFLKIGPERVGTV